MPERNRVIYEIERCAYHVHNACNDCSKYNKGMPLPDCMEELMADALELLKAQEAIEPIIRGDPKGISRYLVCGSCEGLINAGDNFCRKCGRAVKRDETDSS